MLEIYYEYTFKKCTLKNQNTIKVRMHLMKLIMLYFSQGVLNICLLVTIKLYTPDSPFYFGCTMNILIHILRVLNHITPKYFKQHMWKKSQHWVMCWRRESEKQPCVIEQEMLWCLPLHRQISFLSLNVITGCQWAEEKPLPLSFTHTRCLLLFQLQMSSRQHSCRG